MKIVWVPFDHATQDTLTDLFLKGITPLELAISFGTLESVIRAVVKRRIAQRGKVRA